MGERTIPHHDVHETPTALPPEYHSLIDSKGEDHRVEDHDTNPHQPEICYSEVQSRVPGLISEPHTKPPRREDQPSNYRQSFHTYSSFDKALIHPSEVGGTKGGGRGFPWVIAH